MRILAIETVETTGSVALLENDRLVAELALDAQLRSAQSLAPGIKQLFEQAGWQPGDVELVAVASGPGSFTGLRIGVTTAKVFAYARACQVMDVSTMAAIAWRVPGDVPRFSVVVDAYRDELFVADFSREGTELVEEQTTRVEPAERWIAELPPGAVVSGPGLVKHSARFGPQTVQVDSRLWKPTAVAVGQLGWRAFSSGERASPFELMPRYYRRTAAEEKADGDSKNSGQ